MFVFILGMLHSLQTGHGKTILASYLIEENKQMPDAVRFCSYLTVTHLIDVVILAVFFKVFSLIGDVYKYITTIQKIGAWALLAISVFLLVRVVFPAKIKGSFKKGPVLGIIIAFAMIQLLDNVLISPLIVSKSIQIHPLVVIIVILIGSNIGGIFGMLVAVPLFAVTQVVVKELIWSFKHYRLSG